MSVSGKSSADAIEKAVSSSATSSVQLEGVEGVTLASLKLMGLDVSQVREEAGGKLSGSVSKVDWEGEAQPLKLNSELLSFPFLFVSSLLTQCQLFFWGPTICWTRVCRGCWWTRTSCWRRRTSR